MVLRCWDCKSCRHHHGARSYLCPISLGQGAQVRLFDFRTCFTAAFGALNPALRRVRDSADHQVQHQVLTSVFGGKATGGRVIPGRGGMKSIVICSLLGPESFLEEEEGQEKAGEGEEKRGFQNG